MSDKTFHVNWVHGYSGTKASFVDEETLAFQCGNFIKFKKLYSGKEEVFVGISGNGIGVADFHATMPLFAFTDAGPKPGLHVIEYSSSG